MTGARGHAKRRKASNARGGSTNSESKNGERIRIDQQLLPGIPDDVTIAKISPKFSWTALNNLAGVSHGWLRLIQSRQVSEARKVCDREETAFVFRVDGRVHGNINGRKDPGPLLALYSVEDGSVCYLPQIPCFTATTTMKSFTYTSLNGKLYVMASFEEQARRMVWRRCTYVYDLAAHIGWRRCSDPQFVSRPEQSAVMNGKIFVSGSSETHVAFSLLKCAIYDPDDDAWLQIKQGFGREIEVLPGLHENLSLFSMKAPTVFHGSQCHWLNNSSSDIAPGFFSDSSMLGPLHNSLEMIKASNGGAAVAVMSGKFLKMTEHGLDIYDSHTNTWTPLHFESPESNLTIVKHLTPAGWRCSLYRGKNPLYPKRTLDVAVVKNVVYSLERARFPVNKKVEQTLRVHLYRREAVVRDSHQEMPLREKYALALQKVVTLIGSCKCNEILRCPVQL